MFTQEQRKFLKEIAKTGPLIVKGFNCYGIPFVISGELADIKNCNCTLPISDTNLCLKAHICEDVPVANYNKLPDLSLQDNRNIFVELTTAFGKNDSLDGTHLYIECIADSSGQIFYINPDAENAKKNITNMRLADDGTLIESEDEIDDVSKAINNFIGKLVFIDDPVEKRRAFGFAISCDLGHIVGTSKIVLAKNKSFNIFQVSQNTKLYYVGDEQIVPIAENDPQKINELQKRISLKKMSQKTPKPKQPGEE